MGGHALTGRRQCVFGGREGARARMREQHARHVGERVPVLLPETEPAAHPQQDVDRERGPRVAGRPLGRGQGRVGIELAATDAVGLGGYQIAVVD